MEHPKIRGLSGWKPLARGGFTLVWEARQDLLARSVAVKVYQRGLAEDGYDMFAREVGVIGRLSDHPGVVTAYDAGLLPDSRPYVIMGLCPGGSLTQWLNPEDLRSEDQVRWMGVRVADALAAVHAHGVIHRDVKPANILIDSFGSPRLADFGLATVAGTEPSATDALKLTPAYAPPEAFASSAASESGDVYSLAATLYALLSGAPPRSLPTDDGRLNVVEVAAQPITPIPGVNWFLMDVLMAALSSDSAARPSAAELRDRLSGVPGPRARKLKHSLVVADDHPPVRVLEQPVLVGPAAAANSADAAASGSKAVAPRPRNHVEADAPRRRGRRRVATLALAAGLVTVIASGAAWLIAEPASSGAPAVITRSAAPSTQTSTPTSSPGVGATSSQETAVDDDVADPIVQAIRLTGTTDSAEPFETVRIRGTYQGGARTFVTVQHWSEGAWQSFPVPAKTDRSGQFTAYVELGKPSRYRLRVLDPTSGVTSEPFLLVVKA